MDGRVTKSLLKDDVHLLTGKILDRFQSTAYCGVQFIIALIYVIAISPGTIAWYVNDQPGLDKEGF